MSEIHIPVMLEEVLSVSDSVLNCQETKMVLDGTFGRGGHTVEFLKRYPKVQVVGLDRDQAAVEYGLKKFSNEIESGRLNLYHQDYRNYTSEIEFDFILLDLGVSSPQLDSADRGFSFYNDGPLDMRMDQSQELSAYTLVHTLSEDELNQLFREYGEIYSPYRVVRALVNDRKMKPFANTKDLASLIERVDGWRVKGQHPATKYFMALRLLVNQELDGVREVIPNLLPRLKSGGRIAIITFHSLEDRIVKQLFKEQTQPPFEIGRLVNKKVIQASDEEVKINPRSRSAKLRVFEKGSSAWMRKKENPDYNS